MGTYLHLFETHEQFQEKRNNDYEEPWVSYTEESDRVNYNKAGEEKLLGMPFTVEALGSGNITWPLGSKTVQYSKNGGSWETMDSGTTIPVVEGDEVQFKGTNTNYNSISINVTTQFNVKGNIMSLTDGDGFVTADTVNASGFRNLFRGCTYLVSAKDLKLPATTLANQCYSFMFSNCTSLTTAPELPAMTLTGACYYYMFQGCTSLTTAPELPSTTLGTNCYGGMFSGCTSLTTAPELPATAMTNYCYSWMFSGCTSLTTAPELPATTLANYCYSNMFAGCTGLTTAPELPATTLVESCYDNMFRYCTNLNYIKAMFTTTPSTTYTNFWVQGVSSTGTFVKNASATWTTTGNHGIPTGWTVETASS